MTWVKLDDGFFRNPKVIAAGRDARDLHLAATCFSADKLLDGVIRPEHLRRLAADAEIETEVPLCVARLVEVGLWEIHTDGWFIHDYFDYNPTRETVLTERAAAKARMARFRRSSGEQQPNDEANDEANSAGSSPSPVPVPDPDPDPDPDPAVLSEPGEGAKRARRTRAPLTEDQRKILHERYGEAIDVEGSIAYALSTTYADKWKSEFLGLDRWLKGDVEKLTPRNGRKPNLRGGNSAKSIADSVADFRQLQAKGYRP